tara:strand:- start:478 stop:636 length:159 start_codon:yes stop_codon:yes gene_type:complete
MLTIKNIISHQQQYISMLKQDQQNEAIHAFVENKFKLIRDLFSDKAPSGVGQ